MLYCMQELVGGEYWWLSSWFCHKCIRVVLGPFPAKYNYSFSASSQLCTTALGSGIQLLHILNDRIQ